MNHKKALFPGTFDPPTVGHLNIIERASKLFDQVVVAVFVNINKDAQIFSIDERKSFLQQIAKPFSNVKIVSYSGLVADFVKENKIDVIIRGLRTSNNFDREVQLAHANKVLSGVETLFLPSDPHFRSISATLIREIGRFGGDLSQFVPKDIEPQVSNKFNAKTPRR